jgi:hypothetical protein
MSIFTMPLTAPSRISTIVPFSWLRALSFMCNFPNDQP